MRSEDAVMAASRDPPAKHTVTQVPQPTTSTATMAANQLRLWFASMAYVLVAELRRRGLQGTSLENAQAGTIRTRLLKIAGLVKISARRIYVSLSSVHPLHHVFAHAIGRLQAAPA